MTAPPKPNTSFPVRYVVSVGDLDVWQEISRGAYALFLYVNHARDDQWWNTYRPRDPEPGGFFGCDIQTWLDELTPAQLCDLYAARDRAYHERKENPDADL